MLKIPGNWLTCYISGFFINVLPFYISTKLIKLNNLRSFTLHNEQEECFAIYIRVLIASFIVSAVFVHVV